MDDDRIAYIAKLEQKNRKLEAEVRKLKQQIKQTERWSRKEVLRPDSQEMMPEWRSE